MCMAPGEIVSRGISKKGNEYIIRFIAEDDVEKILRYINTLSKEQTFITFQGEEISLEEENTFVTGFTAAMQKKKGFALLVFIRDELAGMATLVLKGRTSRHEGVFGITIAKEFRNEGLGSKLIESVFAESEKLPELKIITLGLFSDNPLAVKLYQKFGFEISGKTPNGILHKGKYVDHIYMHKFVNGFNG